MTGSLGRRYARALLGLAREANAFASVGEELARSASTLMRDDVRVVVLNPGIGATDRRAVVGRLVERLALSPVVGNFIRLLADRDRLAILPDVVRAYDALVDRELGRARVGIRSAQALTSEQLAELEELSRRLTGAAQVVVTTLVDPDMIGGVVLDAAGTAYDGSVKTRLARLADRMANAGT